MAQSGHGIDLAAIYQLLTEISGRLDGHEAKLNQLIDTVNEHSRRFDQLRSVWTGIAASSMTSDTGKRNWVKL